MGDLDRLPPEQRAVLELILERGKTYEEIGGLLGIDAFAVRARAHAALDALGPADATRLTPSRQAELSDYLLDQQDDEAYEATYHHLAGNAASRAWARVVAGTLRTIAPEAIPEIPDEGTAEAPRGPSGSAGAGFPGQGRSSRLGGALLIGGVALLLIVGIYLLFIRGDGDDPSKAAQTVGTSTKASTSTDATAPARAIAQINLLPPDGTDSKAAGLAQVLAAGNQRAIVIAGQGVEPGTYAVWLYTDETTSKLLGFVPRRVPSNGRFAAQAALPADAGNYKELVVTTQAVPKNAADVPKTPGDIVLRGAVKGLPKS